MSKKSKKIIILSCLAIYFLIIVGNSVYRAYFTMGCYMRQKSICSHLPAYRVAHDEQDPKSLDELSAYFDGFPKDMCVCPLTKEKFLYLPDASEDDDIVLADSKACHRSVRGGVLGAFDFLTLHFFAPKGRSISHYRYCEGYLVEEEFQAKIKEQNESSASQKAYKLKVKN